MLRSPNYGTQSGVSGRADQPHNPDGAVAGRRVGRQSGRWLRRVKGVKPRLALLPPLPLPRLSGAPPSCTPKRSGTCGGVRRTTPSAPARSRPANPLCLFLHRRRWSRVRVVSLSTALNWMRWARRRRRQGRAGIFCHSKIFYLVQNNLLFCPLSQTVMSNDNDRMLTLATHLVRSRFEVRTNAITYRQDKCD